MLLKIEVKPEDILFNENGKIIVQLKYFATYSNAAHLVTTEGQTVEDFAKNPGKSNKTLLVNAKGKISLE